MSRSAHATNTRIVVVDVETTGLSVQRGGRVIEVGAVAVEDGVIVAEFATLIDTGAAISYGAYRVHGISEVMLSGQPESAEVWPRFWEFVGNAHLVAHNALFDSAFIRHECGRVGMGLINPLALHRASGAQAAHLPNHKLDTVYCHLLGPIPHGTARHRALDDARLTAKIWNRLSL